MYLYQSTFILFSVSHKINKYNVSLWLNNVESFVIFGNLIRLFNFVLSFIVPIYMYDRYVFVYNKICLTVQFLYVQFCRRIQLNTKYKQIISLKRHIQVFLKKFSNYNISVNKTCLS